MKISLVKKIMEDKKIKTGLALGGGATKSLAVFALIDEIEKCEVSFDYISGTSAGAIIGAHYALFGEIQTLKEEILAFSPKEWLEFADISFRKTRSLIKGVAYRKYLEKKFKKVTFADIKTPLIVTATNLQTGLVEYLDKGLIVDALIASSAVPGVFPPHVIGENIYVDGGVLDNLPYEILFQQKMDRVIALNLGCIEDKTEFQNSFHIVQRSLELMIDNAFKHANTEDENLFVFDVKFKKSFKSSWSVRDLNKKHEEGLTTFQNRETEFKAWLET